MSFTAKRCTVRPRSVCAQTRSLWKRTFTTRRKARRLAMAYERLLYRQSSRQKLRYNPLQSSPQTNFRIDTSYAKERVFGQWLE